VSGGAKPLCAGYVLERKLPNGRVCIELVNFATELSKDSLVMGFSRKGSTAAAGAYGEGMKVEINRLVARGVRVDVFTGARLWSFSHGRDPDGTEEKLFMHASAVQQMDHLVVSLEGEAGIFGEGLVGRSKFLFMQPFHDGPHGSPASAPMHPDHRGGDFICEVLLHQDHCKRIFARGILVMDAPELEGIGLNFVAPLEHHKHLQFTRDRDSIDIEQLIWWLPYIVQQCRDIRPDFHRALVLRLYHIFQERPASSVAKYLVFNLKSTAVARQELADDMVAIFYVLHTDKPWPYPVAAPTSSSSSTGSSFDEERNEATFLQCTPVEVSEPLLKFLKVSVRCLTIDAVWKQRARDVFSIPDWAPPSEEARLHAERFVALALAWFGNALSRAMIVFKTFPAGNQRVVVAGRDPHDEPILAVDVTMLGDVAATHQWISKEYGTACVDSQDNGRLCGGACTMLRYSEAMTACLSKIRPDLARELGKRQSIAMFQMQTRDLANVPRPPDPVPSSASGPTVARASPGAGQGSSSNPQAAAKRMTTDPSGDTTLEDSVDSEAPAGVGAPKGSATRGNASGARPPSQRRGAAATAHQSALDLVKHCMECSSADAAYTPPATTVRSAGSVVQIGFSHLQACDCDGTSAFQLSKLQPWVFPVERATLHLYHEGSRPAEARSLGCDSGRIKLMVRFAERMNGLATDVFAMACPRGSVHVFWEDAERIAFNRQGELFFNARFAVGMAQDTQADFLSFWFVTFCHELAHNEAAGHNEEHEYAEETLITFYLPRLASRLSTMS